MEESSHDGARRRIPQRPRTCDDVTVGYWLTKYTIGMALKILCLPRAWGVKNVPRRGPVILASNHLSFSDHFFGPLPLPRKVIFLGKSEYFTGRGLKGLISRAFFTGVGVIPLDRDGERRASGLSGPACASWRPETCSASTRKAPGARMAACTGARRGSPGSLSNPAPRWSRAP